MDDFDSDLEEFPIESVVWYRMAKFWWAIPAVHCVIALALAMLAHEASNDAISIINVIALIFGMTGLATFILSIIGLAKLAGYKAPFPAVMSWVSGALLPVFIIIIVVLSVDF